MKTISLVMLWMLAGTAFAQEKSLPSFEYYDLKGQSFSEKNLKRDNQVLFVYFNPSCDICRSETKKITREISSFKGKQIVMVSPNDIFEVKDFAKIFKLAKHHNITVLHDSKDTFHTTFGASGYPTMFCYDKDKKLIASFEGETEIEEIRNAFQPGMVLGN